MTLNIPADVQSTIQTFLASGRYIDESDVLRRAVLALEHQEGVLAAIEAGMNDEAAGRTKSAREVIAAARHSLSQSTS